MQALGVRFADIGALALAEESKPGGATLSPWLDVLERQSASHGVALWFVELPMPSAYERSVVRTEAGARLRARLKARIEAAGGRWVDLSRPSWIEDRLFEDGLHLGAEGQKRLSSDLGAALAPLLAAQAPRQP
jgi:hypothetical protein